VKYGSKEKKVVVTKQLENFGIGAEISLFDIKIAVWPNEEN
jgi:hypothetical protein